MIILLETTKQTRHIVERAPNLNMGGRSIFIVRTPQSEGENGNIEKRKKERPTPKRTRQSIFVRFKYIPFRFSPV